MIYYFYVYIVLIASIGFVIAAYTYFTEKKVQADPNYKPFCDISDRVSCTKPMKSSYSQILFFSNATLAIAFYFCIMSLGIFNQLRFYPNAMPLVHMALQIIIACGCLYSLFLAYLLYVKLKTICLLCTAMYVINGTLLYLLFAYNVQYLYALPQL